MNANGKLKKTDREPSGFVKPTKITDELADFLEKPHGIEMPRTQVTREINFYIRANNLADGRNIHPDANLMNLLKIPHGEVLTYFNLQKYMSPHFYKNGFKNPEVNQSEELKQNSLQEEMKQMREEMKQININLEELTKRKLSVTEYFAGRVKS